MELLSLLLVIACCCDYWKGKIPNWLLIIMLITGLGEQYFVGGCQQIPVFLIACGAVAFLLYPLYKIGMIGAGDVKLYSICAGFFPKEKFLFFFFLSLLFAAMISLMKMIKECNALERLVYFCDYVSAVLRDGHFKLYLENEAEQKAAGVCLAGPILASVLLYMGGVY